MDPTWVIYGLREDVPGAHIRYVGLTTRKLSVRLRHHKNDARAARRDNLNYRWIRSIDYNVVAEVIELCVPNDFETLCEREVFWISCYRELHGDVRNIKTPYWILNLTDGGEGASGYEGYWLGKSHTEETKQKMSAAHMGRPKSIETRTRMSAAQSGENNPHYGKPSWNRGKPMTEEWKANLSASKKGKPNRGRHTRWHVQRGIVDTACIFCQETD